jgi:hypothetical protein
MVMITALELVLDSNETACRILRNQVDAKVTHRLLTSSRGKRDTYHIAEKVNVLEQPGRKLRCLVPPHLPERHTT